jgi:hypothetical protein
MEQLITFGIFSVGLFASGILFAHLLTLDLTPLINSNVPKQIKRSITKAAKSLPTSSKRAPRVSSFQTYGEVEGQQVPEIAKNPLKYLLSKQDR